MDTHGLPDMYTLSPRACSPHASDAHIKQTTCAHVTNNKCLLCCTLETQTWLLPCIEIQLETLTTAIASVNTQQWYFASLKIVHTQTYMY